MLRMFHRPQGPVIQYEQGMTYLPGHLSRIHTMEEQHKTVGHILHRAYLPIVSS